MTTEQKIELLKDKIASLHGHCECNRYADRAEFFYAGKSSVVSFEILELVGMETWEQEYSKKLAEDNKHLFAEMGMRGNPTSKFQIKDTFPKDNLEDLKDMNES